MTFVRITLTALLLILGSTLIPSSAHASSMSTTEVDQQMLGDTLHHANVVEMPRYWRAVARAERIAAAKKAAAQAARNRPRRITRSSGGAGGDLLDRLANCESSMNRVTGGKYHSYFQWSLPTWHSVSGLPGAPESYDYETQKAAAAKIPVSSWHSQFPGCSRKLGV